MNTFTDFIAVAEHLIEDGYARRTGWRSRRQRRRPAHGRGREYAPRPLPGRRARSVPFVDVINTMLDETLPLTVGEFEEWGNPKSRTVRVHEGYSPYDNVAAEGVPGDAREDVAQRQPGHVLGARQVGGEAAHA